MTPILEIEGTWEELSAKASEFSAHRMRLLVLPIENGSATTVPPHRPTVRELLRMPLQLREPILAAQAAGAEELYPNSQEISDFDALGDSDMYDETP